MRVANSLVKLGEDGGGKERGEDGQGPVQEDGPVTGAEVEVRFRVVDEDLEAVLRES